MTVPTISSGFINVVTVSTARQGQEWRTFFPSLSCAPTEPSLASVLGGGNREFDLSEFMDEVWPENLKVLKLYIQLLFRPLTAHSSNEVQMTS